MPSATQLQRNFKAGDAVIYEFTEGHIHSDGHSFTDGYFITGGSSIMNRCYPVTDDGKFIAQMYRLRYESLRKTAGVTSLNYPSIQSMAADMFGDTMNKLHSGEDFRPSLKLAMAFFDMLDGQLHEILTLTVKGFPLLRR